MKLEDIVRVGPDTDKHVDLCMCWRYEGQPLPSGTRIDLRCAECGHRVAADPNTVRFAAAGARILCNQCIPTD